MDRQDAQDKPSNPVHPVYPRKEFEKFHHKGARLSRTVVSMSITAEHGSGDFDWLI
jgi:hypothetical protein